MNGLIKENTVMDDKKVLIGKVEDDPSEPGILLMIPFILKKDNLVLLIKVLLLKKKKDLDLLK